MFFVNDTGLETGFVPTTLAGESRCDSERIFCPRLMPCGKVERFVTTVDRLPWAPSTVALSSSLLSTGVKALTHETPIVGCVASTVPFPLVCRTNCFTMG